MAQHQGASYGVAGKGIFTSELRSETKPTEQILVCTPYARTVLRSKETWTFFCFYFLQDLGFQRSGIGIGIGIGLHDRHWFFETLAFQEGF
jgi:hypothetical protein